MNYLVVVAHPDDEVLGAGATIKKLISEGNNVAVAIMCDEADARQDRSSTLAEDEAEAMRIMNVTRVYHSNFPNIKMNTVSHFHPSSLRYEQRSCHDKLCSTSSIQIVPAQAGTSETKEIHIHGSSFFNRMVLRFLRKAVYPEYVRRDRIGRSMPETQSTGCL